MWSGLEVEGRSELGFKTLFVRDATLDDIAKHAKRFRRVWFTKEFRAWYIVIGMIEGGWRVALDVPASTIHEIPLFVLKRASIYAKFPTGPAELHDPSLLRYANVLAFGEPFSESFYELSRTAPGVAGRSLLSVDDFNATTRARLSDGTFGLCVDETRVTLTHPEHLQSIRWLVVDIDTRRSALQLTRGTTAAPTDYTADVRIV